MRRPRVVLLRGHSANPWELRTWELLADRYDVAVAVTRANRYALDELRLERVPVASVRGRLPRGRLGDALALAAGDGYRGLERALRGADIVHAAELGVWFSGQPARLKRRLGYRLVTTVWETIPFRETFRAFRGRRDRRDALAAADLYLAATERARRCLLLEGAEPERVVVAPPGVDVERFAAAAGARERLLVSPGRLVWEKGHFDVLRALTLLPPDIRALLVGAGPEEERLRRYARDLGVAERIEIRAVPHGEMPGVFGRAGCVVLASLPTPLWEEQFGMVLAEAMAAGAPVVAAASGAIPEVLSGSGATSFRPGDWVELAEHAARALEGRLPAHPAEAVSRYSSAAAAARIAEAYGRVLSEA